MHERLYRNALILSTLALVFLLSLIILLAIPSAAEGTVMVTLDEDVLTQEDTGVDFNSAVSYTGTKGLAYSWSFGDGTSSTVQRPNHAYTHQGNYTVTLTVTDSDGISDTDSLYVEVLNVRPIADAGGPKNVFEGTLVTFDGSNSWDTPSDLPLLTYEWDFGDGSSTNASKDNKVVAHEYAEAGVYVVRLVVKDDDWTSSNFAYMESSLITITGAAEGNGTVMLYYDLYGGNHSENGSSNNSSSGPISIYWDFGDGSFAKGANATHTYDEDGVYVVTLIVSDAFGAMSVHHIFVTVLNSAPTAEAGPDVVGEEDEKITFTGLGSDPGGGPVTYSWDFGDGWKGGGQVVNHSYTKQGVYTVTLSVSDSHGLTDSDTCNVTVNNVVPVAGLTSNHTTKEGDVIGFSGTTSIDTPSDLPLLVYSYNFGDGTTGTGMSVSHAYADEGTFTVTLTVTDDDGAKDNETLTFVVDNADPVATITSVSLPGTSVLPGETVNFTGSHTDAGIYDTHTYSWDFGDGDTGNGTSVNHSFSSSGTFTIKLTVTDNDGGVGTATVNVSVDTPENLVKEGLDLIEKASTSSFSKPSDQESIEDKFADLIYALESGSNNVKGKAESLSSQVSSKVTDKDLREYLLDNLDRILDTLD